MLKPAVKKRIKSLGAAVICCAVIAASVLAFPVSAPALNADYMSPDKWAQCSDKVSVPLEYANLDRTLSGVFSFYKENSLCIYTFFKISETTLSDSANNVSIVYDFRMGSEKYTVITDGGGMSNETAPQEKKLFSVRTNYSKTGEYLSAVEYTGKGYTACSVDITLNVNGINYRITQNRELYGSPIALETVEESEAPATDAKKKDKDKKENKNGKEKDKTKKGEATTKFQPSYNITTGPKSGSPAGAATQKADNTQTAEPSTEAPSQPVTQSSAVYVKTQMTKTQKLLFILGIIIAATGLAVMLGVAVLGKSGNKKEEPPGEEDVKE